MVKIQPVKKSIAQILKKQNFQQKLSKTNPANSLMIKNVQEPVTVQSLKDDTLDTFVKETARDMLRGMSKYELKVNNPDAISNIYAYSSENSIWAPWGKLANKK